MSILLTVYDTPVWKTFIDGTKLPVINEAKPLVNSGAVVLQPPQALSTVSALVSGLATEQTLWLAAVQAEYFLANALENGAALKDAAQQWQQQTTTLLTLQRQQRKKLQLFNVHQALARPVQFRQLLSPAITLSAYPEYVVSSNLALLAACQYLTQEPELQFLNTHLQASVLPLCDSETPNLNIDQILLHNHVLSSASQERDAILAQLHQVQEQLEQVSAEHSTTRQTNTRLEEKLATADKAHEQTRQELEKNSAELRNTEQSLRQSATDLQAITEERNLVVTQLHQVQEQLEQYYIQLQTEQKENKHTLLARDKQQAKEISKLEAELRKVKSKLANAEYAGMLLQKELAKLRSSISWKAATPVRVIGRLMRKNDPAREKLMQEVGLLLTSEFFDVDWYVRTYTDVAESQMNPAEHYLLHGAAEGRLPGPLFDGNWYLQHYPDVAKNNMNPLLHFVMYGQQEGRTSSPKLLTNNQNIEE